MLETQVFMSVLMAMLSALVYGFVFFSKEFEKTGEEQFSYEKMLATLVVSIFVGLIGYIVGVETSYENFVLVMTSYAGSIAIIETIIKSIMNWHKRKTTITVGNE